MHIADLLISDLCYPLITADLIQGGKTQDNLLVLA